MSFEHELARLRAIDWSKISSHRSESHIALVKEFLARAASIFAKAGFSSSDPFVPPTEILNRQSLIDEKMRQNNEQVASSSPLPLVQWVAGWHLDSCLMADLMNDSQSPLSQLYEPLIVLFSDGGSIDKHHGEIIIDDKYAISSKDWQIRSPLNWYSDLSENKNEVLLMDKSVQFAAAGLARHQPSRPKP
jgi:hypothetical protein